MKKKKILMILLFLFVLTITTDVLAKCPGTNLDYVGCGSGSNMVTGIPAFVPRLIAFGVNLMRIIIPLVLIITGTIEMFKSIISGNPDNIAKCRKRVISKYIGALLAFFIISFTTNIVKLIARGNEKSTAAKCFNCYLNNKCITQDVDPSVCKGVGGLEDDDNSKSGGSGGSDTKTKKCNEYSKDNCPTDKCVVMEGKCTTKH